VTNESQPKQTFIDRRLRMRLRIFGIIFLVMFVVVVVDFFRGTITAPLGLLGLAIGLVIGIIVSRMYRLSWSAQTNTVISRLDWLGVGILILYVVFALLRNQLFGSWIQGTYLAAFTLSISAGMMLGRVIGTMRGIRNVLDAWKLTSLGNE
jgi:hypothetical protein